MGNFNSTMVRLKLLRPLRPRTPPMIFQFHYGSIEASSNKPIIQYRSNFNSTMVRLKLTSNFSEGLIVSNFNSTMVRLKLAAVAASSFISLFQFHYGSIEALLRNSIDINSKISIPLWFD
ncbi:hypothetical protein SAMN05444380_11569 [Thermophagus xiamenensis]|uniref:Uncharacterized protein n=1 Tax=Thermophagus xiamenensis TaxID=385682 RepID=A0A1I2C9R7_9BACT|nr:hypothetical protein SAMN05444380_11569 [Thermophagus xiamenensis]